MPRGRLQKSEAVGAVPEVVEEPSPPPARRVKRAMLRPDICQRHRMRKVITNGGKSWRCRR